MARLCDTITLKNRESFFKGGQCIIFVLIDLDTDVYNSTYYSRVHEEERKSDALKEEMLRKIHKELKRSNEKNEKSKDKIYRRSVKKDGVVYMEEIHLPFNNKKRDRRKK